MRSDYYCMAQKNPASSGAPPRPAKPVVALKRTLALLALSTACLAQVSKEPQRAPDLAQRVDDYLQRCGAFGFSGSVLIAVDDGVVLSKGYGVADRKTGALCTSDTIFDLGSLSKQFTATVVLALAQQKKLKLDDKLSDFFDDVPSDKRAITLHQLLAHTSGLPRGLASVGSRATDREKMLRDAFAAPLAFKPGKQHLYSNLGYDVLAAVVEIATKKPFEDVVHELAFTPSKMTSTGFRQDGKLDAARAARGEPERYDPPPAGSMIEEDASRFEGHFDEKLLATDGWYTWGLRGAGGVLSTVGDLWLWEQTLRGDALLDTKSKRTLWQPVHDNYACGWYVLESPRNTPWIAHGGSTGNGFDVYATRYPEERVFFTVLGNTSGVVPWVNLNVGKLIFGEQVALPPAVVALDEAALSSVCGVYECSDARLRVTAFEGAWSIEALDAKAFEALTGASGKSPALDKSRSIVAGLARDDFKAFHAAESQQHPLNFMEGWWGRMKDKHGPLKHSEVLGAVDERGDSATVIARLEFERGGELMRFLWSAGKLSGVNIGAPYPSRVRLVPTSATTAIAYDLVSGKTTCSAAFDRAHDKLELKLDVGRTTWTALR